MATLKQKEEQLIDLFIETEREEYHDPLKSFDNYKTQKKEEYLGAWNDFTSHLAHGYQVIIETIEHNEDLKKVKGKSIL